MAPIIHCVRHAQGFHNLCVENRNLPDPRLTPLGEEQCAILASTFPSHSKISLVIASPLTRTIQTALYSFGPALANGKCRSNIIALPEAQETTSLTSDTGSNLDVLTQACQQNQWPVDLSLVHEGWNNKSDPKWQPTYEALSERAKIARAFVLQKVYELQAQGEESPEIIFVAHGGYFHYFTEDWEGSGMDVAYKTGLPSEFFWGMPGTGWHNCEVRSYNVVPDEVELASNPRLIETAQSRTHRGVVAQVDVTAEDILYANPAKGREYQAMLSLLNPTFVAAVQRNVDQKNDQIGETGQVKSSDVKA